jgi:hypothetical protein
LNSGGGLFQKGGFLSQDSPGLASTYREYT